MTLQSVTGKGDAIGGDLVERLSTGGAAEHSWASNGSRCVVVSHLRWQLRANAVDESRGSVSGVSVGANQRCF